MKINERYEEIFDEQYKIVVFNFITYIFLFSLRTYFIFWFFLQVSEEEN
jgi:hypothetical protein